MPYLITAGRAVCILCGVDVDNRWQAKAEHDREHVRQRLERDEGGENR